MKMSTPKTDIAKAKELQLPLTRIKTIMRSSPDVEIISSDALFLVTKVTELFIAEIAKRAHQESKSPNSLDYKDIAEIVQEDDTLDFLREIMPRKITVRQYKQLMAKKANKNDSGAETDSEDESDESGEEEESESEE